MRKIQWNNLPPALRDHFFDRLRDRQITAADLYQLKLWRESEPEAPMGIGIWISARLKSAEGEGTPKHFFFEGNPPKAKNCERQYLI